MKTYVTIAAVISLFGLVACGGSDGDPNATPTPEPVPVETQLQDLIERRLALGWSVKSLSLASPKATVEVDLASPYDFEFEKKPEYAQETQILRLCPRAFELSSLEQVGLHVTFIVNGANGQDFPSITCP